MNINKNIYVLTEPAVEPVNASDYRDFVRMTSTEDDNLISKIIISTRRLCERYMARPIVNTTFIQGQDLFDNYFIEDGLGYVRKSGEIYIGLQKKRLSVVNSVKLYNYENTETIVSNTNYRVDTISNKVVFNWDYNLPILRQVNGIQVEYVAGMGATAEAIPQDIKDAIIMYSKAFYEVNRTSQEGLVSMPSAVKEILDHYRDFNLAG